MMKKLKKIICCFMAAVLMLTVIQYDSIVNAADAGTPVETKVDKVVSGYLENHISFLLSEADYTTFSILGADHEEYSYWNNIKVYTSETEYVPLSEVAVSGEYYYNLFGTTKDITLKLNNGDSVTKIVIPAGTVFPSEAYTGGIAAGWGPQASVSTSTAMNGYKIKKELTLTRPDAKNETLNGTEIYNWTIAEAEPEPGTPVETKVDKVVSGYLENHISFLLSEADYTTFSILGADHEEYSYWNNIKVYTSETEYVPLSEVAVSGEYYYNLFGTTKDITLKLNNGDSVTKIVIPAGTVFPSEAYTGGIAAGWGPQASVFTSTAMNGYKIKKELTLTRPDAKNETLNGTEVYNWTIEEAEPEPGTPVDSGIQKVISGHNGNHLSIQLTASDYATFTTLGNKHTDYSYWNNIKVYTSETEYKPLSEVALHSDYYYNLCGTGNDISFNMQGVENTATKIVIPEGTVFPSLAYTGGGNDKLASRCRSDIGSDEWI